MIEAAGRRRLAGDWRGACHAANLDQRIDLAEIYRRYGSEVTGRLIDDLRHLAPDLLRWQLPRKAHGPGLLRSGLLIPLAEYDHDRSDYRLMLAAFTSPAGLAAGERVLLLTLELTAAGRPTWRPGAPPWPGDAVRLRNSRRYGLQNHRQHWDARAAMRLLPPFLDDDGEITRLQDQGLAGQAWARAGITVSAPGPGVGQRGQREAAFRRLALTPVNLPGLLAAAQLDCPGADSVVLLPGSGFAIVLDGISGLVPTARLTKAEAVRGLPVVPAAGWSRLVDADLLRLGFLSADDLHPLIAVPAGSPSPSVRPVADQPITVRCLAEDHRVVRSDNGWQPTDHEPVQLSRERKLALLGGPVCGCLRAAQAQAAGLDLAFDVAYHLAHGQPELALGAVQKHRGRTGTFAEFTLPDDDSAAELVSRQEAAALRYQLELAGLRPHVPTPTWLPRGTYPFALAHRNLPRRNRKGVPARPTRVMT